MAKGFGFRMAYTVNFENATADYDLARADEALQVAVNGERTTIKCDGTGHLPMIQHFVLAVQSGTQPTVVSAEDGVAAIEVCEAEAASAR